MLPNFQREKAKTAANEKTNVKNIEGKNEGELNYFLLT